MPIGTVRDDSRLLQRDPSLDDHLCHFLSQGKSKFPPPWLVAMQRYGPPPSYPSLKIPGLNAPIPEVSTLHSSSAAATVHVYCFTLIVIWTSIAIYSVLTIV